MNRYPDSPINIAGGSGALGGIAGGPVRAMPPSLEQRLDNLQRAAERANDLRNRLDGTATRLAPDLANRIPDKGEPSEAAKDFSSRLGETIKFLHSNLDQLEHLAYRIDVSLFGESIERAQAQEKSR